jgi:hypothetical protein
MSETSGHHPPESEIAASKSKEHVLYAPKIIVVPDTHGLDPAFYGITKDSKDVVSLGDIIDAPKNSLTRNSDEAVVTKDLKYFPSFNKLSAEDQKIAIKKEIEKRTRSNEAVNNLNIRENVEVWTHLMETDSGTVVLGNHELMAMSGLTGNDHDLQNWLLDANKGRTTLDAFGIDTSSIPALEIEEKTIDGKVVKVVKNPLTPEQCQYVRDQVTASPELSKFFDQLHAKGKMYAIANEALVVHAGISVDSDGNLIPPQRRGGNWPGFDNITGLDAMDKIEEGIRSRDPDMLHWAASGSSQDMSPGWMREPFFNVMRNDISATKAMTQLSNQAAERGAAIQTMIVGHTEKIGGQAIGKYVLGADTGIGDVINLTQTEDGKQVVFDARHNFSQKNHIGHPLTHPLSATKITSHTEVGDPVVLSRDALLHGDGDEEDEGEDHNDPAPIVANPSETPPIATSETPPSRGILGKFKTAIVSALGRHDTTITTRDAWGKEVSRTIKSRDVFEVEQDAFAKRRATESKDKWDPQSVEGLNKWQRFGKKVERFFDRSWRSMATEKVHAAKEKKHGIDLSATVGIEGAISEEFHTILDTAARDRLNNERVTRGQKLWGGTKDFFQEFVGHERDLHKFKLQEAERLAAEYRNNPADRQHPLYHLINRDTSSREELAARINESPLELLHETNDKDKKVEGILLEGEQGTKVDKFLKENIIERAMDDIISQQEQNGGRPNKISEKLRRKLDQKLQDYFFSSDFQSWRDTLTTEQQQSFENSFTVASDVLLQFEEGMAPAIIDNLEHYKGAERLDFEIELSLGTAQLSANSESMGGTRKERTKERASLNEKIWNRTQNKDVYSNQAINNGLKWEKIRSAANMIFTNEAIGAWAGAAAGRGVATTARAGLSWLPVVGSAGVAGTMAGFKEWARHGQMRSTYGMGRAEGLEFPEASNATRTAEMRLADYHRLEFSRRTQQFMDANNKLNSDSFNNDTILLTMAQIADSGARLKLNNERDINLLMASADGPEGRGIRNRELRIHDHARSIATGRVRELLSDQTRLDEIATDMGFTIPAGTTPDEAVGQMLGILQDSQYNSLLGSTSVNPDVVSMIGGLSPDLAYDQQESIHARDKVYNGLRWKSTGKRVATSAAVAGLMSWGMGNFSESQQQVVETGTEHQLVPLINHDLPQHVDPLTTGDIHNSETGDILATMHAHVPAGTHLELTTITDTDDGAITHGLTSYNLVTDHLNADGDHDVLVPNMQFGSDGQLDMSVEVREALTLNHIDVNHTSLDEVGWGSHEEIVTPTTEIDYTQWDNTLHYKDFPGQDIDAFFAKNINESLAANPEVSAGGETLTNVERVTDINGLRNLMRGMENWVYKQENFHVNQIEGYNRVLHSEDTIWSNLTGNQEVISEWQSDTTDILHVPDLLATADGNRQVVDLIHEAVRENATGDPNFAFSDEAHRIAWEMSYWGDEAHIPDANEVRLLLEHFGEIPSSPTIEVVENTFSATPHDVWFTMTEDLTKVVEVPTEEVFTQTVPGWTSWLASSIGYSRPLEASKTNRDRQIIRTNPYGNYEMYGYGFNGISEQEKELYQGRLSETLKNNPSANLDATIELPRYFEDMDEAYKAKLNEYLAQPGMSEPMNNNCEAIIAMPVYTLGEGKVILDTLEQYALQFDKSKNNSAVDPSKVELALFLNYPKPSKDKLEAELNHSYKQGAEERVRNNNPEMYDTEEVIRQFMAKHPEMNIRIMTKEFDQRPVWGSIIKPFYDTIMLRSNQRSAPTNNDPLLITNDADVVDLSPAYLKDFLVEANKNISEVDNNLEIEKFDGWVGKIDMPNHGYEKYPGFLFAERLYQFLDSQSRRKEGGVVITQGRNTAVRLSSLAAVGGINPNTDAGADTEIGRMIASARNNTKTIKYLNRAWLHSDPRRELDMWKKGVPLAYAWNEWAAMNVYGEGWQERFTQAPEDPGSIRADELIREIEAESERHGLSIDSPEMRFALVSLGLRTKEQLQEIINRTQGDAGLEENERNELLHKIGLSSGDYSLDNNIIVIKRADFEISSGGNIIINRTNGVVDSLKAFVTEKRWKRVEGRRQNALESLDALKQPL